MAICKWRINANGELISPEAVKSWRQRNSKSKEPGDKYLSKITTHFCPKCGAEITVIRRLKANAALGIKRDVTAYVCKKCFSSWSNKQVVKLTQRFKKRRSCVTNEQFKQSLTAF